jgi:hypothetical protein
MQFNFNLNWLAKKNLSNFLHICCPLLIGIFIYLFLRPIWPNAIFNIFHFLEINIFPPIISTTQLKNSEFYNFLLFNLSDALWAYSFGFFICMATQKESLPMKRAYHFIAILTAMLQELLQGSVVEGTYDPLDLFLILVAYTISVKIFWNSNEITSFKN